MSAEVTSAYDVLHTLADQVGRLQNGFLQRAEEARRIAEGAYREGATPLMLVLDASRTLVDAQQAYYRTLFAQHLSVLELNAALGSADLLKMPVLNDTAPSTSRTGRGPQQ